MRFVCDAILFMAACDEDLPGELKGESVASDCYNGCVNGNKGLNELNSPAKPGFFSPFGRPAPVGRAPVLLAAGRLPGDV